MQIDYDTIYNFDLTGKVKFGDLPEAVVIQLFKDGRVASKFIEHHIPEWFPELEFVDQKGYDHVDKATGERKWDLKGFTKGGACYAPSTMLGAGRKIVIEEVHAHAKQIDYIFSDVTEFPKVRIQFRRGVDMVTEFPTSKVSGSKEGKAKLFNGKKVVNG